MRDFVVRFLFFSEKKMTTDESGNIVITHGTLPELIKWLTHLNQPNFNLRFIFLLTYRAFTKPVSVIRLLIHRYFTPKNYSKKKAITIKIKYVR